MQEEIEIKAMTVLEEMMTVDLLEQVEDTGHKLRKPVEFLAG